MQRRRRRLAIGVPERLSLLAKTPNLITYLDSQRCAGCKGVARCQRRRGSAGGCATAHSRNSRCDSSALRRSSHAAGHELCAARRTSFVLRAGAALRFLRPLDSVNRPTAQTYKAKTADKSPSSTAELAAGTSFLLLDLSDVPNCLSGTPRPPIYRSPCSSHAKASDYHTLAASPIRPALRPRPDPTRSSAMQITHQAAAVLPQAPVARRSGVSAVTVAPAASRAAAPRCATCMPLPARCAARTCVVTAAAAQPEAGEAAAPAPLAIPRGPSETVSQAAAAVRRAWEAGVKRQRVELLLPLIGATDLDGEPRVGGAGASWAAPAVGFLAFLACPATSAAHASPAHRLAGRHPPAVQGG